MENQKKDKVYRIDPGPGALEDSDYYTTAKSIVSKNGCAAGVKALHQDFYFVAG